jgi:glycosyltransferase involved in cell wall biosynthesis
MANPDASILIPCRNARATLAATLESALAQDGIEKEIIVVDDGSTDGSLDVAKGYEARGVRVIEGPRINASAARNRALRESRARYVQFLDADDLLGADKIRRQIDELRKCPGFVASARWGRFREAMADAVFADDSQLHDWTPAGWLLAHCSGQMMHPGAWLVPRDVAEAAGPWDESLTLNDDGEYFARVVAASQGIKCVPEAVSYYRTNHATTLSKTRSETAFASLWTSVRKTGEVMLSLEDSPSSRRAVADMSQRFIFEVYPSAVKERASAAETVARLGGSSVQPPFGPASRLLAKVTGWQFALQLTRLRRRGSWF